MPTPWPVETVKKKMDEVVAHLTEGRANFATDAAQMAGIPFATFYDWREHNDEFRERWDKALNIARERRLDWVESKLLENIDAKDNTAMIFWLKTQGRNRNYNERIDINQTVTHTHQLDITEAARRLAFAMNTAIERGDVIEGEFSEVVRVPTVHDERRKELKEAGFTTGRETSEAVKAGARSHRRKAARAAKAAKKAKDDQHDQL